MSKRMILTIATVLCVIMTCMPLIDFISPCSDGSADATSHSGDSESFTDNDIVYEISGEDTVTVTGNIARYGVFTADVPATIDHDGTTYTVTAVIGFIQIETLNLPSTVSVISLSDLTSDGEVESTGMKNINVDENNPVYASVNGVLYSKDMSRLVYFPMFNKGDGDGKFTILPSITVINSDAFRHITEINKFSTEGNTSYKADSRGFLYTADGKKIVRACGGRTTQTDPYNIPEEVTEICDYAFCSTSMKKISISKDDNGKCSLTKIGYAAFRDSYVEQMKYEDEPDNNAVKIPNTVNSIGDYTFNNAAAAVNIVFEDGSTITKIGDGMFRDIHNLKSVAFPAGLNEIGKKAFELCFQDMENPGEMILPEGLKKIDDRAFSMCYFLKNVKLPSSLEYIGDHAFNMCISLESVEIPKNLTTLGDGAYSYTMALTEFTVSPDNVVFSVDDGVLYCGDSLAAYPSGREKTDFEIKTASVCPSAFEGSNIVKVEYAVPFKLTENLFAGTNIETLRPSGSTDEGIIIPEGNTEIPKNAFHYCKEIKDVIMSDGIQCIGEHSFEGCTSLTDVVLPYGVETIADSAFSGCVIMNAIVIPDTVSEIGPHAFDIGIESSSCKYVYVSNNENLVIGDGAFSLKFFRIVEGAKVEIVDPYELKGNTYGFEDPVFVEQEKESEGPVESGAPATIVLPSATLPEDVRVVVNGVTLESGYEYDMKKGTVTLDTELLGKGTFTVVIINPDNGVILKNSSLEVKRPQPTPPEPKPIPVVFYKVSYDINGGSEPIPGTMSYEKGETAFVAPYLGSKDSYTFGGWQCNGKIYKAGDEFTVNSDMNFVAVWNSSPSPGPEPSPQSDSNTGAIVGAIVAVVAAVVVIGVAVYFLRNKH